MNRTTWLTILQGIGITGQLINAGIGTITHSIAVALIVGSILAGYQFVIQRLGNNTDPVTQQPASKQ